MALFRFPWVRRYIRRNTKPIPFVTAETWKNRLSLGYAFLAWNAFGFVCYAMYKGKTDWAKYHGVQDEDADLTQAQKFVKRLGVENATVMHYSGFTKTKEYKVEKETDDTTSES
uniref:Uncharacterized protein n=1 Tax=Nyssomyia neivai TaxID=330878 RepID=A0A1L8DC66_9DIPT